MMISCLLCKQRQSLCLPLHAKWMYLVFTTSSRNKACEECHKSPMVRARNVFVSLSSLVSLLSLLSLFSVLSLPTIGFSNSSNLWTFFLIPSLSSSLLLSSSSPLLLLSSSPRLFYIRRHHDMFCCVCADGYIWLLSLQWTNLRKYFTKLFSNQKSNGDY